jgi:acyl-coenzyme A thioesterase PaaI-like protein
VAATPPVLRLYRALERLPAGKWLFARAICWKAPYFGTIRPRVQVLEPGRSVWSMRKRRAVHNHIGTVHALAIGNLCELCAGLMIEASLPPERRWIPKRMNIEYLKKAQTDLVAEASASAQTLAQLGEVPVSVEVSDARGEVVVRATIYMHVSERPPKAA